ncbi:MAG: LytR C-terminal domain-containing protein [Candidatus Nanopelagicales bacterium]
MTTYSGEDGMTGTDQPGGPGLPDEPSPYGVDAGGPVSEPPPAYEYPYPDDTHSYNATDVLPAPLPSGGRKARRQAEEEARAAEPPTGPKAIMTGTPSGPGRVIVPAAVALVSAVALAAAWMHLESDRSAEVAQPAPVTSQSPAPSGSPSTAPSASASTRPSPSSSASASPKPTASASPAASSTATAKPVGTVDRSVPVVVLNATGRPGLAAKVAAKLRAEGWKVTSVGNWTKGGIDATTIYLNGHVAARDTMIKDLPAADGRVELPLAGMPKMRLVVVVGKDYPA